MAARLLSVSPSFGACALDGRRPPRGSVRPPDVEGDRRQTPACGQRALDVGRVEDDFPIVGLADQRQRTSPRNAARLGWPARGDVQLVGVAVEAHVVQDRDEVDDPQMGARSPDRKVLW